MCWIPAILFFLLSPGVLITIPPRSRGLWMSGQTSLVAVIIHTVLFAAALYAVHRWWGGMYEGFSGAYNTAIGQCFMNGFCGGNVNCKGPGERCNPVTMTCQQQIMIPSSLFNIQRPLPP